MKSNLILSLLLAIVALTAHAKDKTIVWEQPSAYIPAKSNRFKEMFYKLSC